MSSLRSILRRDVPTLLQGVTEPSFRLGSDDRHQLRTSLESAMRRNDSSFKIAFLLSVGLALATLGTTIWAFVRGDGAVVSGLFGISTAGAVAAAMNAWREKNNLEILLTLAGNLDDDALRDVLKLLLSKLSL